MDISVCVSFCWMWKKTSRLAAANRLHISICGWRVKIFLTYNWITKQNLVVVSHTLCIACRRCQKFGGRWCHALWEGAWLTCRNTLLPHMCYRTKFHHARSNRLVVGRGPKKFGYAGPTPWEWGCGWCARLLLLLDLVSLGQTEHNYGDCQKILTPQGHWRSLEPTRMNLLPMTIC